jgi:hypothetical protein
MASSASDLIKFEKQATGENASTWGTKANTAMSRIEEAIAGFTNIAVTGANYTLNDTQYTEHNDGSNTSESHVAMIKATGTLTGNRQVIVPLRTKHYMLWNGTGGAYALTIGGSSGGTITVPQGFLQHVFCDGTNVEAASPPFNVTGQQHYPKGGDISSASPLVIDTDGDMFDVTGTTNFAAMTVALGRVFILQFDGALTMTHGAGTLDLLGGANITTVAGDTGIFYSTAANVVRQVGWIPVSGFALSQVAIAAKTEVLGIVASDETTALTTGTAKATFHMPFAMTLTGVKAGCTTAPTGATLTIDINEAGSTILTTKLTIDASEKTSATAATAAVIGGAGPALASDALMTIDIDQVGSSVAGAGLKVYLIGYQT